MRRSNKMNQERWKKTFGENLVDILKEKGMTQYQLAKDAGLSKSRVSEYINGVTTPSIFAIINMAYALDIDVGELVDFDERVN
jgi:transcriptional regulator with XRE-family HTH domain